jgi:hypothetical protein
VIRVKASALAKALCFGSIFFASFTARCGSDEDHLRPADLERNQSYRKVSLAKLAPTKFDCGRAFTLPAFTPESCVSVYSSSSATGRDVYFVTYVTSQESLWQRTDGGNRPEKAAGLTVHRLDTEIPAKTGELIKQVWRRMLEGTRKAKVPSSNSWHTISIDGTDVEFSIERANARPLYGALNVSLPAPGKKTKELVRLSKLLTVCCKAKPAERPRIANEIDREANDLLAQLKRKG